MVDKYSVLSGDSIKRISMLEADKNHPTTPEHRSNSLTTQDMLGEDDVSANDRHSGISHSTPNLGDHEDPFVEETPEFSNTLN